MHVNCPNCATMYDIPTLERSRRLRCAHCAAEWRENPAGWEPEAVAARPEAMDATPWQEADAPEGAASEPVMPFAAPERLARPEGIVRCRPGVALWSVLWVLSLLLIAGGLIAVWHWRVAIGQDWPPSRRLYGWVGGLIAGRPSPGGG